MFQITEPLVISRDINETTVQEYFIETKKTIKLFGATEDETTDNEIKEMLNFEIELAKIMPPIEDSGYFEKPYNLMKFVDLRKNFPSIPLQEILTEMFNPMSINQDEVINVNCPKYLSDLGILLSKTPKRYGHTQNEPIAF